MCLALQRSGTYPLLAIFGACHAAYHHQSVFSQAPRILHGQADHRCRKWARDGADGGWGRFDISIQVRCSVEEKRRAGRTRPDGSLNCRISPVAV